MHLLSLISKEKRYDFCLPFQQQTLIFYKFSNDIAVSYTSKFHACQVFNNEQCSLKVSLLYVMAKIAMGGISFKFTIFIFLKEIFLVLKLTEKIADIFKIASLPSLIHLYFSDLSLSNSFTLIIYLAVSLSLLLSTSLSYCYSMVNVYEVTNNKTYTFFLCKMTKINNSPTLHPDFDENEIDISNFVS